MSGTGPSSLESATGWNGPGDTPPEVAELQRRIVDAMDPFERLHAMGLLFDNLRALLALRYDNPVDILRHLHGDSLTEADYLAIARQLGVPPRGNDALAGP